MMGEAAPGAARRRPPAAAVGSILIVAVGVVVLGGGFILAGTFGSFLDGGSTTDPSVRFINQVIAWVGLVAGVLVAACGCVLVLAGFWVLRSRSKPSLVVASILALAAGLAGVSIAWIAASVGLPPAVTGVAIACAVSSVVSAALLGSVALQTRGPSAPDGPTW